MHKATRVENKEGWLYISYEQIINLSLFLFLFFFHFHLFFQSFFKLNFSEFIIMSNFSQIIFFLSNPG